MTQPSRTTETINRDHAAIRDIMHQVRELTVPDRATLAVGLVGHLATMMNRSQMTKLMDQLREEAERVQDVPPNRQRADDAVADHRAEHATNVADPADATYPADPPHETDATIDATTRTPDDVSAGRARGRWRSKGGSTDPRGRAVQDGHAVQDGGAAQDGHAAQDGGAARDGRAAREDSRMAAGRARPSEARKRHGDVMEEQVVDGSGAGGGGEDSRSGPAESRQGVGQAGRGEFRSGRLL